MGSDRLEQWSPRRERAYGTALLGVLVVAAGVIALLGAHWGWLAVVGGVLIVTHGLFVIDVDGPTGKG